MDPQQKKYKHTAFSETHQKLDRREFTRVCLKIKVEVTPMGGESIQGWTSDISMGGWFVVTEQELPVGTPCVIKFDGPDGVKIVATGRIVRNGDRGIGGELLHMDIESYCNLGRLIRLSPKSVSKIMAHLKSLPTPENLEAPDADTSNNAATTYVRGLPRPPTRSRPTSGL